MGFLIRALPFIVVLGLLLWMFRVWLLTRETKLKCRNCVHCKKLFHDGSICRFGTKETFKTIVHIENCMDHEKR